MKMQNKIKIRWKSGLILLVVLYFLFYCFFFAASFSDYFTEFFKCSFNVGGYSSGLSIIDCANENVTPFLFLVFLVCIFVFSVYKTEKIKLENKYKLNWALKFHGVIMLASFLLFLGFILTGLQFSNLMNTIPPDDTMIGLPPQTRLSFLTESASKSLVFSFFSTLFFSYIPSRIIIRFFKKN